jgi:hypothetical protein
MDERLRVPRGARRIVLFSESGIPILETVDAGVWMKRFLHAETGVWLSAGRARSMREEAPEIVVGISHPGGPMSNWSVRWGQSPVCPGALLSRSPLSPAAPWCSNGFSS